MPQPADTERLIAFGKILDSLFETYDDFQANLLNMGELAEYIEFDGASMVFIRMTDEKQFKLTLTEYDPNNPEGDDDDG